MLSNLIGQTVTAMVQERIRPLTPVLMSKRLEERNWVNFPRLFSFELSIQWPIKF
jgi:hypothetical protein